MMRVDHYWKQQLTWDMNEHVIPLLLLTSNDVEEETWQMGLCCIVMILNSRDQNFPIFFFLKSGICLAIVFLMPQGYIATCGLGGHSTACFCRQRWTLSFLFILLPLFAMHCILFCFCYILTYICIFILLIKNLNPPFFLLMSIY